MEDSVTATEHFVQAAVSRKKAQLGVDAEPDFPHNSVTVFSFEQPLNLAGSLARIARFLARHARYDAAIVNPENDRRLGHSAQPAVQVSLLARQFRVIAGMHDHRSAQGDFAGQGEPHSPVKYGNTSRQDAQFAGWHYLLLAGGQHSGLLMPFSLDPIRPEGA